MSRFFLVATPILFLNIVSTSFCMGYIPLLPDIWLPIIANSTPSDRNALRKVCKVFSIIVSKNNIVPLLNSTSHTYQDSDDNICTTYRMKLSTQDFEDALVSCIKLNNVDVLRNLIANSIITQKNSARIRSYATHNNLAMILDEVPLLPDLDDFPLVQCQHTDTSGRDLETLVSQNLYTNTLKAVEILLCKLTIGGNKGIFDQCRALHSAIDNNDIPMTELLLSFGIIDVHHHSAKFGGTPLGLACAKGYPEIVALLLRDRKHTLPQKFAAITSASHRGNFECMKMVITSIPPLETFYLSPYVKSAVMKNNAEAVEFFLHKYGPDVNLLLEWADQSSHMMEINFETLLHKIIRNKNPNMLQQLIEKGADITTLDSENRTPLELANHLRTQEPADPELQEIIKILSIVQNKINAVTTNS